MATVGPIVGIFTQPSTSANPSCGGHCDYLAASYVKLVESGGGRVVPIAYNASSVEELDILFDGLNGLLLPGGSNPPSWAAHHMIERAVAANRMHDFFPVLGICLGLEWLMLVLGGNDFKLDGLYDAENISLPLDLTDAAYKSRLFADAPPELLKIVGSLNVTMNNHHYGVTPEHFTSTPALHDFFRILSTNVDRQGRSFVSTVEARDEDMPIWGLQWHPEKNVWEWGKQKGPGSEGLPYEAINHSPEAQEVTRYVADFFLQQARKSTHRFEPEVEQKALIYNYSPVLSGSEFVQAYYFHW